MKHVCTVNILYCDGILSHGILVVWDAKMLINKKSVMHVINTFMKHVYLMYALYISKL